jgi:hypothetical protein
VPQRPQVPRTSHTRTSPGPHTVQDAAELPVLFLSCPELRQEPERAKSAVSAFPFADVSWLPTLFPTTPRLACLSSIVPFPHTASTVFFFPARLLAAGGVDQPDRRQMRSCPPSPDPRMTPGLPFFPSFLSPIPILPAPQTQILRRRLERAACSVSDARPGPCRVAVARPPAGPAEWGVRVCVVVCLDVDVR